MESRYLNLGDVSSSPDRWGHPDGGINSVPLPIHVNVLRDDNMAKFWIQPVRLAVNIGFPPKELRQIEKLVEENNTEIERKWNEFFSRS